jgi:hypothetical protein
MSTAHEIEEAIRTLPSSERDKLLRHIPALFPELAGDAEWERVLRDERPRPELSRCSMRQRNSCVAIQTHFQG